jgi:hypothetical protein
MRRRRDEENEKSIRAESKSLWEKKRKRSHATIACCTEN